MPIDPEKFVEAMKGDINCRRCGLCCIAWKIPVTDDDVEREPKLSEYIISGCIGEPDNTTACQFYTPHALIVDDDGKFYSGCTIHETRPQICRDFNSSPLRCMSAFISSVTEIDINKTIEDWKEQGVDEISILSRIHTKYLEIKLQILNKNNVYVIGGRTIKDDLSEDFLLKTVHERILDNAIHSTIS